MGAARSALKGTMVQRLANFVLTPVLFTSAVGLMVFYAALWIPWLCGLSAGSDPGTDRAAARSVFRSLKRR